MEKYKRVVIVVADGRVETVFTDEKLMIEIVDFDSADFEEQKELADYVDECRATMKETVC